MDKTVVLVSSYFKPCGIAVYTRNLSAALNKVGVKTILIADKNTSNIPHARNIIPIWSYKHFRIREAVRMISILLRFNVIHYQFEYLLFGLKGSLFFLVMLVVLKLSGKKQVITLHSTIGFHQITDKIFPEHFGYYMPAGLLRFLLHTYNIVLFNTLNYIIVHTNYGRRLILTYKTPSSRIVVIPHGIVVDSVPAPVGDKIVFHGFLKPSKGLHLLLDAVAPIKDKLNGAKILVQGYPANQDYVRMIRSKITSLNLENNVVMNVGWFSETDVENIFSSAKFLVVCYTENIYGSSGVVSRALGKGIPILYSPQPLFREELDIYAKEGLCICANPLDRDALSKSILFMLNNSVNRARIQALSITRSWDKVAVATREVYNLL